MIKKLYLSSGINNTLWIEYDHSQAGYLDLAKELTVHAGASKIKNSMLPNVWQPWDAKIPLKKQQQFGKTNAARSIKRGGWYQSVKLSTFDQLATLMTFPELSKWIKNRVEPNNTWIGTTALIYAKQYSLARIVSMIDVPNCYFPDSIVSTARTRTYAVISITNTWEQSTMPPTKIRFCSTLRKDKINSLKVLKWLNGYSDLAIEVAKLNSLVE